MNYLYAATGWFLGFYFLYFAFRCARQHYWTAIAVVLSCAIIPLGLLWFGPTQKNFDVMSQTMYGLGFFYVGFSPWAEAGKVAAANAHLSLGGAKVLGVLGMILGLIILIGTIVSAVSQLSTQA